MKTSIQVSLILVLATIAGQVGATSASVCGTAYAIDSGVVEYEELHFGFDEGRLIEYRDIEGQLIATNRIDYTDRIGAPEYRQQDLRHDRELAVRWQDDQLMLFRDDRTKVVDTSEPIVIGAGFDQFVLDVWPRLIGGERIEFDFPLPNRLRILRLAIEQVDAKRSKIDDLDKDWVSLRIAPASRVFRLFVDSIDLAYDKQKRRLRIYRGLSNISAAKGGGLAVTIAYAYSDELAREEACSATVAATERPAVIAF